MAASASYQGVASTSTNGGLAPRYALAPQRSQTQSRQPSTSAPTVRQLTPTASSSRRAVRLQVLSTPERGSASVQQPTDTRNIVVAVDASEDSIAAFNWVVANMMNSADTLHLHLLHVVPDCSLSPASGSIYYCSGPDPESERAVWQQAKQFFEDNFVERAKAVGLTEKVTLHLVKESRYKHIGKAVCLKAEELHAEPLVVAAHDKGAIETLLTGSVSKFCVAHSKRPVLLLHPNHSNI